MRLAHQFVDTLAECAAMEERRPVIDSLQVLHVPVHVVIQGRPAIVEGKLGCQWS